MTCAETHEQAMACFGCGAATFTPSDVFPLPSGICDLPCPTCGGPVWVTEPRERVKRETEEER